MDEKSKISFDEFGKLDIRIGEIISAERVEGTDKLLKLTVDLGEGSHRQIIAGIAEFISDPEELIGKSCPFLANLESKTIRNEESDGMILAVATSDGGFSLLVPEEKVPLGSKIR